MWKGNTTSILECFNLLIIYEKYPLSVPSKGISIKTFCMACIWVPQNSVISASRLRPSYSNWFYAPLGRVTPPTPYTTQLWCWYNFPSPHDKSSFKGFPRVMNFILFHQWFHKWSILGAYWGVGWLSEERLLHLLHLVRFSQHTWYKKYFNLK